MTTTMKLVANCFLLLSITLISKEIGQNLVNLEEYSNTMVISTKRIILPQFPHAFNPSLVRWNNRLLLSFRVIPDSKQPFTSLIGLTWLNENFDPIGTPHILPLRSMESPAPSRAEDGRLLVVNNTLLLMYSDNDEELLSKKFRMFCAELEYNGASFIIKNTHCLATFDGEQSNRREKNWVPFDYRNSLLLAYSLHPHKIFYPLFAHAHAALYVTSDNSLAWSWGEPRGGTPALLDHDTYLAFFHSSKKVATVHSQGKEMMHYVMGAYTFSREYPFKIQKISPEPIVAQGFYEGEIYKPYWGSVRCVFPCGFIMNEEFLWIAYGRQDHEMWIAKLDKKKLYDSLIPVA